MTTVHARVFLTVGAWLLGVVGATGGSLAAVSLIGQSIAAPPTQQLTVSAVNRALASGNTEARPSPAASPFPAARHRAAAATPSPPRGSAAASPGTLLNSAGGSVVARCDSASAYLISWSPQQGYAAEDVIRGPAPTARVTFMAGQAGVILSVTCPGSTPTASINGVQTDGDTGEPGDN